MKMKKSLSSALATSSMAIFATAANAQYVRNIETPGYAEKAADYLTRHCPTVAPVSPDQTKDCIKATTDIVMTIADDLKDYIDKHPSSSFNDGVSNGDLLRFCTWGMRATVGHFDSLKDYYNTAISASTECLQSIDRSGRNVGIQFEPTAYNTVANHVNHLRNQ